MFSFLEEENESQMRELRRLTTQLLLAARHGNFTAVAKLRASRQHCLEALAAEPRVLSQAA